MGASSVCCLDKIRNSHDRPDEHGLPDVEGGEHLPRLPQGGKTPEQGNGRKGQRLILGTAYQHR